MNENERILYLKELPELLEKEDKAERERLNYIRSKGDFRAMMKALPEMPPVDSLSYKLRGKKLPFNK